MAPARLRGTFSNGFQHSVGIGVLPANVINFGMEKINGGWGCGTWRVSLTLAGAPHPRRVVPARDTNSLVQQGARDRHDIARLLQKICGPGVNIADKLDDIVAAIADVRQRTA